MLRDDIIEEMARALFVSSWADREEEAGRSHGGEELMDIAPPTPKRAVQAAKKLAERMEDGNNVSLDALYILAAMQPGKHYKKPDPHDFGHYVAMQALGHGVSWWDDHPNIKEAPDGVMNSIKIPHIEFY
jgi:hypothetical protein